MSLMLSRNNKRGFFSWIASCLLALCITTLHGQVSTNLDSLKARYHNSNLDAEEKTEILILLSKNSLEVNEKLAWSDTLLILASEQNDYLSLVQAHLNKAYAYNDMGNYYMDIKETLSALEIADSIKGDVGNVYNHLASSYADMQNLDEAKKYYLKAIRLQLDSDSISYPHLASSYYNYSDFLLRNSMLDSAYVYLEKAREAARNTDSAMYNYIKPYLEGNLGVYHFKKGQYEEAKPLIEVGAKDISLGDGAIEYYNYLTDIAQVEGDLEQASNYARLAISIADSTNSISKLEDTYLNLFEIEREKANFSNALDHYLKHQAYRDSSMNLLTIQQMFNISKEYEVANVQKEADLMAKEAEIQELRANRQRTISIVSVAIVILLSLLIFGLFNRFKYIRRTSRIIEKEKERSDKLLKNILPEETADELKVHGKVGAKQFDSVSVMFIDFCGFTRYSQNMDPDALVKRVDFYFSRFDEIMEKYDLEKIKTMGDAYMCAGGLPFPSEDHARRMVLAAFEMADFVKSYKEEAPDDPTRFDCRIGITTGPVVAGVVGTKKFVYDIWGDTVNIASRMESNSEPGKINVSENTYQIIKDEFDCDFRGMVEVKNKGMMRMYFVNRESEVGRKESGVVSRKDYG